MTVNARELQLVPPSSEPTPDSPRPPRSGQATVTGRDERGLVLDGDEPRIAERAASCLLEPMVGDRVWFVEEGEECFVTAVLRRAEGAGPARLRVDGDAELCADGKLSVTGDALELHGRQRVDLHADELLLRARQGRALVDECSMVLRELFAHAGQATVVGTMVELLAEHVRSHSKTSRKVVEQLDHLQAGHIEHRATEVAQLSGKQTLINGAELIKADGGQIHLG
ncbi:DUF3540 domain-containing protein [Paraliomyxa miuraensis]|uniref:DUF3540 domain-containing protein n=1 Tax=Paraliomyxa miuraensis TaxID=376150 RepID=UPI00225385EC|nr:DUF3540 domain-containing protein [Paraliomyxa miuraensis]MCX4246563.1 DUF3540 domain-containing protein [Paraliomyxa miuraensis]